MSNDNSSLVLPLVIGGGILALILVSRKKEPLQFTPAQPGPSFGPSGPSGPSPTPQPSAAPSSPTVFVPGVIDGPLVVPFEPSRPEVQAALNLANSVPTSFTDFATRSQLPVQNTFVPGTPEADNGGAFAAVDGPANSSPLEPLGGLFPSAFDPLGLGLFPI